MSDNCVFNQFDQTPDPLILNMPTPDSIPLVINVCYGGFGLSKEGAELYDKLSKHHVSLDRFDPVLIQVIETLGVKANCNYSKLGIVYIPGKFRDCIKIDEYDGLESIEIDLDKYILNQIHCILTDTELKSEEKVMKSLYAMNNPPDTELHLLNISPYSDKK